MAGLNWVSFAIGEITPMTVKGNKRKFFQIRLTSAFSKVANFWHLKNFCYILTAAVQGSFVRTAKIVVRPEWR
jgi:hypothetical protein